MCFMNCLNFSQANYFQNIIGKNGFKSEGEIKSMMLGQNVHEDTLLDVFVMNFVLRWRLIRIRSILIYKALFKNILANICLELWWLFILAAAPFSPYLLIKWPISLFS